jgi:hypothetical protein
MQTQNKFPTGREMCQERAPLPAKKKLFLTVVTPKKEIRTSIRPLKDIKKHSLIEQAEPLILPLQEIVVKKWLRIRKRSLVGKEDAIMDLPVTTDRSRPGKPHLKWLEDSVETNAYSSRHPTGSHPESPINRLLFSQFSPNTTTN